jgi:hypothetical protein
MARLARLAAVLATFSLPIVARGGGLTLVGPPVTVVYFCPAPMPSIPRISLAVYPLCIPPPPVCPLPAPSFAPLRPYAPPTAAPPSAGPSTPEPPLAAPPAPAKPSAAPPSRSPGFGESTSFYDAYPVAAPSKSRASDDRCTVDFWNLTSKDLILRINGEPPFFLPHSKSLPVTTGRQFHWQVEGRQTQATRVQDGESALQIVIRR